MCDLSRSVQKFFWGKLDNGQIALDKQRKDKVYLFINFNLYFTQQNAHRVQQFFTTPTKQFYIVEIFSEMIQI